MQEMQVHIDTKTSCQDANQQVNMAELDSTKLLKGTSSTGNNGTTSLNKYINHNVSTIEPHKYAPVLNNTQGRLSAVDIAPVTEVTA